jgi:hypothetical protein
MDAVEDASHEHRILTTILSIGNDLPPPPHTGPATKDEDNETLWDVTRSVIKGIIGLLVHTHYPPTAENDNDITLADRTVCILIYFMGQSLMNLTLLKITIDVLSDARVLAHISRQSHIAPIDEVNDQYALRWFLIYYKSLHRNPVRRLAFAFWLRDLLRSRVLHGLVISVRA